MENENDQAEILNQQEEEVLETSNEQESEQEDSESVEEYKARLAKAEELANNYKVRAEKAERLAKTTKPSETHKPSSTAGDINTKDLYALMEAKVPQEDIDEVINYSKFRNISVGEALKSNVVKSLLSEKAEQRTTASAANVGGSRRSPGKLSDDVIVDRFAKGAMPESDDELRRLIKARKGIK